MTLNEFRTSILSLLAEWGWDASRANVAFLLRLALAGSTDPRMVALVEFMDANTPEHMRRVMRGGA